MYAPTRNDIVHRRLHALGDSARRDNYVPGLAVYKAQIPEQRSYLAQDTNMRFEPNNLLFLICGFALCSLGESVPAQDSNVVPVNKGYRTSILQHPTTNNSVETLINPKADFSDLSLNHRSDLKYFTLTWPITTTLSLKINVGPWQLSPERILECLETANATVGKKVATHLLERRFTQSQGSRLNTLLFEIGPELGGSKRLTWADVALVLGRDGLVKFFLEERYWTSTYFDVMHSRWGKLGEGAVRKWYQ